MFCAQSHQKGGARYSEGLFVEVGAAEQQQNVAVMFSFVKLEHLRQLPQLIQVWGELKPEQKDTTAQNLVLISCIILRESVWWFTNRPAETISRLSVLAQQLKSICTELDRLDGTLGKL